MISLSIPPRAFTAKRVSTAVQSAVAPKEDAIANLKHTVTRQCLGAQQAQLKRAVIEHVRKASISPPRVRSFFEHRTFRYAAAFMVFEAGSLVSAVRFAVAPTSTLTYHPHQITIGANRPGISLGGWLF